MHTNYVKWLAGPLVILLVVGIGWQTRNSWKGWLIPAKDGAGDEKKDAGSDNPARVKLSKQAQDNLRLKVERVQLSSYQRRIYLPGAVVDKPGRSDRGIPAPITGVVTNVSAIPGKTFKAGDELFTLRIASESFQASQMELYKNTQELVILQKEKKRLDAIPAGAVPETERLKIDYQNERVKVLIQAYKQDLQARQLTPKQIKGIEGGTLVTEVVILMPKRLDKSPAPGPKSASESPPIEFEVQELKVNLGDHVQAGQMLAYLADHRDLYVEGRALRQEAKLLAQAAKEGWPVEAEFTEDEDGTPGERLTGLSVEFLGNTMDAAGLTLPVYVPFTNPHKDYVRDRKTYRTGAYRPGQKVLLKVTVAKLADVIVLPLAAVVREGPEAYVFRQNGPGTFDRRPVHVILEDSEFAVIANDGSIIARVNYIAQNAAAALNRALKASQAEGGGAPGHTHN